MSMFPLPSVSLFPLPSRVSKFPLPLLTFFRRCVFIQDGQWVVAAVGEDSGRKGLRRHANYESKMYLLFENEASIDKFLADTTKGLEALRNFVALTRKYRNVVVMTVEELYTYCSLQGVVSRLEDGFWVEELGSVTITPPDDAPTAGVLESCQPAGQWEWRDTSQDFGAYTYERFLQFGESVLDDLMREQKVSAKVLEETHEAMRFPEHSTGLKIKHPVRRLVPVDVMAAATVSSPRLRPLTRA